MATKKRTKKTGLDHLKDRQARDLGTATGVAEARGKDLGDVFRETAEEDAETARLGQSAKHVKACHQLCQEAEIRLRASRKATSPHTAIEHDLRRVIDLTTEIREEAEQAVEALGR